MSTPTILQKAKTSAFLSLLFIIVYGSCNWITAQRSDVGVWFYPWEHHIPFVPLMIVPYVSIDLFFVTAPFLCRCEEELRTFSRRITLAIVIAGACFLLIPLRMAFPRSETTGWTGTIFEFLHGFDQPYNLFPSLHITLRTILAALYARHTKGAVRVASHVWFSLIGFSTLLTYQHHVVDVIGGFVLAAFCFYLIRDKRTPSVVIPNLRVATYYGFGGLICGAATFAGGWAVILLWPAFSLGFTAVAYCGLGPEIYRKENGRLPLSAKVFFAPNFFGQWISLLCYRRTCTAWNEVTPNVWIGTRLTQGEAELAISNGVTAVLDLTAEFSEVKPFLRIAYRNLPVLDLTEMTPSQLAEASEFISEKSRHGIVYVHCKVGYSRSAAAAGAYLLISGKAATVEQALNQLRAVHLGIIIRPEVVTSLQRFANGIRAKGSRETEPTFAERLR